MTKVSETPYSTGVGTTPKLRRSVVAFVDILGYRQMVAEAAGSTQSQDLLERLSDALQVARAHIDPRADGSAAGLSGSRLFAMRSFTDNIVIGYPIADDGELELGSVWDGISYFQMRMSMAGFFVRGGLAVGDLYMDDVVVYGEGLIQAYEAESTLARDPRIVLAKTARDAVDAHLGYYTAQHLAPQVGSLLRDVDDQYFVDYLSTTVAENGLVYDTVLATHKQRVEASLKRYRIAPNIWAKYAWAARYHNYFCDRYKLDERLRVSPGAMSSAPGLIVEEPKRGDQP